mmetsp:Transcript_6661/g.11213  ORF Transcript_6661/g.11213 Transcript_6661/m.11213 type:complete len:110 (+) Transcript_6661:1880-2209(+)
MRPRTSRIMRRGSYKGMKNKRNLRSRYFLVRTAPWELRKNAFSSSNLKNMTKTIVVIMRGGIGSVAICKMSIPTDSKETREIAIWGRTDFVGNDLNSTEAAIVRMIIVL